LPRHPARGSVLLVFRAQDGQATVELLGVLPALVAAGLLAWQLVLVGHTGWLAADAARVAARAELVGEDPVKAARSALPAGMERGLEVSRPGGGATRVHVNVPAVHPAWRGTVPLSAAASLEAAP
jgi:hypothetical protein